MALEDKSGQFGQGMWGESSQPTRKYSLPARPIRPKKPEAKKTEVQKGVTGLGVFGKQGFLEKRSLLGKLRNRQDFFTDSNIKMSGEQRSKFAEKLKNLLPKGKSTFNIGDVKVIDKKLKQQEFLAKNTQEKFKVRRERAALKKLFELKK
jgi:hypothetical protein